MRKIEDAEPRWKSRFGLPTAVMDANPCTKRIKDLQEQIHAREFGLGDRGWARTQRKEKERVRERKKKVEKNGERRDGREGELTVPDGFK